MVKFGVAIVLGLLLLSGQALAFTDTGSSPYVDAIDELAARGIISGYDDDTFRPQNPLWRAQFAKMITGTLALEVFEDDPLAPFTDLGPDATNSLYPHEYVAAAYFTGITKGRTATTFQPWTDIPRAQVITMVVRAVDEFRPDLLEEPPADFAGPWGFFDQTHEDFARKAFWNGLDSGLSHSGFQPWGKMPRGEVAQILWNLLALVEDPAPPFPEVQVTRVVDGDTIEVDLDGQQETVRLIGIDAPELEEPFSAAAADHLQNLMAGQQVYLELDVEPYDQYNRLLAYVWLYDGEDYWMANEEMLLAGLAVLYTVPPNVAYAEVFEFLQQIAQIEGAGMWGGLGDAPLQVVTIHADAAGDDNSNLNDEWIEFRVLVSGSLAGYAVEDMTGHRYEFPERVFQAGQTFRLHTGSGTDTQSALYWGLSSAVWNNDGDVVTLLDPQGYARLQEVY